ncbi:MAG: hypothetical protein ABW136_09475 [Steroidobacteraceae bacterium]
MRKFAGLCAALGCVGAGAVDADEAAWHEMEAGGYTVLSQLDERDTRYWVTYFDQFVAAMSGALEIRGAKRPPLTVVLFEKQSDLLAVSPPHAAGCGAGPEGPHVLAFAADAPEAARRALFHAGAHWITASGVPQPAWLDEGLAQLFASFGRKGMQVHWGDSLGDAVALLKARGPIPMDSFLKAEGHVGEDPALYHAQALVVTHWLMIGRHADALGRYLSTWRSQGEAAALEATFADGPEALTQALQSYVERPAFASAARPRQISEQRYLMTPASPARLGRALALLGGPERRPVQAFNAP